MWDQNVFNDLYRRGGGPSVKDDKNVVTGYDGKLKVGILPVSMFASGHTYFVQRMHEKVGLEPYVVHALFSTRVPRVNVIGCARHCFGRTRPSTTTRLEDFWCSRRTSRRSSSITRKA